MGLRDRIDKLRNDDADDFEGETRTGEVDYEDFAEVVECIGDMFLYGYAAEAKLDEHDSVDAEVRAEEVSEINSNNLDTVGVFDVTEVCEENGIDFREEVINQRVK